MAGHNQGPCLLNRLFECSIRVFRFFKFSLAGNLRGFPETPGNPPLHAPDW